MAQLTRQQITTIAKKWVQENMDKPGWREDYLLQVCVDEAADEIAGTDGLKFYVPVDVVINQLMYAATGLFKVTAARIVDPSDGITQVPLQFLTRDDMDAQSPGWTTLSTTQQGLPTNYVSDDFQGFALWPVPDYALPAGLIVEGYGTPSDCGPHGSNLWPQMTQFCPLPSFMHYAVAKRAAHKRCIQFADSPAYAARITALAAEYELMKKSINRKVREQNRRVRTGQGFLTGPWVSGGYGGGYL